MNTKGTKVDSDAQRLEMERKGITREFWIKEGEVLEKPTWIFT